MHRGVVLASFVTREERCDLFWETETRIGSDIPSPVLAAEAKEGSAYPINSRVDDVWESRGGK